MSDEQGMSWKELIQTYGGTIACRASEVSGRGHHPSDMNAKSLESLYQGIVKEKGQEAAVEFVKLVEAMTKNNDISGSTFAVTFEKFGNGGYKYTPSLVVSPKAAEAEALGNEASDLLNKGDFEGVEQMAQTSFGAAVNSATFFKNNAPAIALSGGFLLQHTDEMSNELPNIGYISGYGYLTQSI